MVQSCLTMAIYIVTSFIIVALTFLPLLSCAPLKENKLQEDPDLYRNAVTNLYGFFTCDSNMTKFYDITVLVYYTT